MISPREVVQDYLDAFCPAAARGEVVIHGSRPRNREFMLEHGLDLPTIQAYLAELLVEDYSTGPEADDRQRPCEIWKFGPDFCSTALYVKLARWVHGQQKEHHCVSFKATQTPLHLPYRK